MGESGDQPFQQFDPVQSSEQLAQPARVSQEREEMLVGLGGDLARQAGDVLVNRLPGLGRNLLVIEVGQIRQIHDRRNASLKAVQGSGCDHHLPWPDQKPAGDPPSQDGIPEPLAARRRAGLGDQPRGKAADLLGVAKVFAHELLDRLHAGGGLVMQQTRRCGAAPPW